MDSRGGHEPLYRAHPDWFAVDADGKPYRSGELYQACINGPYYDQYVPQILREIIERSHPQQQGPQGVDHRALITEPKWAIG